MNILSAARRIGTIFVQRDSKNSRLQSKNEIEKLLSGLTDRTHIAAFPSGTTTLFEEKPWKKGLFEIAKSTNSQIQPFRLHYSHPRDCAYIDDDQLFTSLIKLISIRKKMIYFTWGDSFFADDIVSIVEKTRKWTQNVQRVNVYNDTQFL